MVGVTLELGDTHHHLLDDELEDDDDERNADLVDDASHVFTPV